MKNFIWILNNSTKNEELKLKIMFIHKMCSTDIDINSWNILYLYTLNIFLFFSLLCVKDVFWLLRISILRMWRCRYINQRNKAILHVSMSNYWIIYNSVFLLKKPLKTNNVIWLSRKVPFIFMEHWLTLNNTSFQILKE